MICPPTFGMYAVAARIQGAAVIEVPLRRDAGYDFDVGAACWQRCDSRVKLVFLCSPNNPTGNRLERIDILELARALEGRALVVVDEAYVEFADAPSLIGTLAEHPGLVVLRTLSKAYALGRCALRRTDRARRRRGAAAQGDPAVCRHAADDRGRILRPSSRPRSRRPARTSRRSSASVRAWPQRCRDWPRVRRVWPQ